MSVRMYLGQKDSVVFRLVDHKFFNDKIGAHGCTELNIILYPYYMISTANIVGILSGCLMQYYFKAPLKFLLKFY